MPIVLKSGSLNLLEPSGPVQTCSGIALPSYIVHCILDHIVCIYCVYEFVMKLEISYCVLQLYVNTFYFLSHSPMKAVNPLKPDLNSICYLLALLGAHHFLHVSRIRVKLLTLR